ncbi:hypothetical protein PISMIDRAFT_412845 [Pisolithus microcarpus 441]|uniref:Uncharacterized protein n=1 Tax=Pisolithus microcarpus 441 TaxID=765257 RepID=A0A0C9ZPY6_9AGAM|nr:hypothetical protein BKA83DRAFT_412845 [Pisolithus microcarpus]KIK24357.1 hypothetical protein PISMIDRAFT_412845 [Pisolithus microcarpus 441]
MMAVIKKKGYVVSSNAGTHHMHFARCLELTLILSGCVYLTKRTADGPRCTVLGVNREVADLAITVKKKERKQPDHIDTEEKEEVREQKQEGVGGQKNEEIGEQKEEEVGEQEKEEVGEQKDEEEVGEQNREQEIGEQNKAEEVGEQKEEERVGELKNEGEDGEQDEEEVGHENIDTTENSSEAGVYITPQQTR